MAGKTGEAGHSPAGAGLAGATGGKEGKPLRVPGRQGQQETNWASPRRGHEGQGEPTTNPLCAPAGTANARRANAARVQVGDAKGRSPLHKKN
ncbi:MAG: hypothetical protein L6V84_04500 [Oscillospiraceae bacterium]|nr:MAG: hypothetical protein L6V84_04500 [Oscillospiraceae bacterium]